MFPEKIQEYLSNKKNSELALIGCRADNSNISYECCEYDIAVLAKNGNGLGNSIVQIGKEKLEFLDFSNYNQNEISLLNMKKIENKTSSLLIPHKDSIRKTDIKRIFLSAGKRRAVDSLFNVSKNSTSKSEYHLHLILKILHFNL